MFLSCCISYVNLGGEYGNDTSNVNQHSGFLFVGFARIIVYNMN